MSGGGPTGATVLARCRPIPNTSPPGPPRPGAPPHVWASLITTNDPSTPQHLHLLRPMEQLASTCIRLANDLQSYTKELNEGKINALVILSQSMRLQGYSMQEAY